jgi:hypothetical protein
MSIKRYFQYMGSTECVLRWVEGDKKNALRKPSDKLYIHLHKPLQPFDSDGHAITSRSHYGFKMPIANYCEHRKNCFPRVLMISLENHLYKEMMTRFSVISCLLLVLTFLTYVRCLYSQY